MRLQERTFLKFLLVGSMTVGIDFSVYAFLSGGGLSLIVSKGIAFVIGSLFAFVVNAIFTFNVAPRLSALLTFLSVYLGGLFLNVATNTAVLSFTTPGNGSFYFSFLTATAVSLSWNYWGMARLVFHRASKQLSGGPPNGF